VHYPRVARVVEATCREYGVAYREHRTFAAGIASHYHLLRRLGRPDTHVAAVPTNTPLPTG
jgi:linoleoyl-CoA desaturase